MIHLTELLKKIKFHSAIFIFIEDAILLNSKVLITEIQFLLLFGSKY